MRRNSINQITARHFIPTYSTKFNCMFCGFEHIQWIEVEPENWVAIEIANGSFHPCYTGNYKKFSRNDVINYLQKLGFEQYYPKSLTWTYGLIKSNKAYTIYFLIRRGGMDFIIYHGKKETILDEKDKLQVTGIPRLNRYNYSDSKINIHIAVLTLASQFVTDTPLYKWLIPEIPTPEPIKSTRRSSSGSSGRDMYEAMSHDDGEDAYMGGGMWIGSDGSFKDKGR